MKRILLAGLMFGLVSVSLVQGQAVTFESHGFVDLPYIDIGYDWDGTNRSYSRVWEKSKCKICDRVIYVRNKATSYWSGEKAKAISGITVCRRCFDKYEPVYADIIAQQTAILRQENEDLIEKHNQAEKDRREPLRSPSRPP